MKYFIPIFLCGILLYHILVTFGVYGIDTTITPRMPSLLRDGIRFGIVGIFFFTQHTSRKRYFTQRKWLRIATITVIGFSIIVSLLFNQSAYSMLVGIKYDFTFMLVFLSATFIGFVGAKNKKNQSFFHKGLHYLPRILITVVSIGFVRQLMKFIWPEGIMHIGYGPIGDFVFGTNPPLYYRTGPGGRPRWQGLFAGPNNYGYFLIAFFPLILHWLKHATTHKIIAKIGTIIRTIAIILTLSRAAYIGAAVAACIVYKHILQQHKRRASILLSAIIIGIITLFIVKSGSTIEHLTAKRDGIQTVINHPRGFGLGTAGPAIHHEGLFLPENFYLQLMLDIGTIGFLLRIMTMYVRLYTQRNISYATLASHDTTGGKPITRTQIEKGIQDDNTYSSNNQAQIAKIFTVGFFCLLIMGLFLHVFEDSMVNYLFFIPYGILLGYMSNTTCRNQHCDESIECQS